ncbi:MAG: M15 family metallopeptidase [Chthoniobacterales bacterium]
MTKRTIIACTFLLVHAGGWAGSARAIEHDLVPLDEVKPPALPEVRYATRYNFTGEKLYPFPRLWLHRQTCRALSNVQADLRKAGYGLKIFDAYRPLTIQWMMWNLIRDERYVSNPAQNRGRHTRGTAVDVTLVDAKGRELPMPSDFDDFTDKAHRDYAGGTAAERANREILAAAMSRHGFIPYPFEWWHFDLRGWEKFPVLDISLTELARGTKVTVRCP